MGHGREVLVTAAAEGGLFDSIGEAIGAVLGWIIDLAAWLWDNLAGAIGDLFAGIARGAGMEDAGFLSWLGLGFGLFLIVLSVQGFLRRTLVGAVINLVVGLAVIAWSIS